MKKIFVISILFLFISAGIGFAGDLPDKAAKQETMTTQFSQGEKIITHPSGVVSVYTQEDSARFREELVKQVNRINDQIAQLDQELTSVASSMTAQ